MEFTIVALIYMNILIGLIIYCATMLPSTEIQRNLSPTFPHPVGSIQMHIIPSTRL